MDNKCWPIRTFLPEVILRADASVIGCCGEIKEFPVEDDRAIGSETGEELVYGLNQNLITDRNLRHLGEIGGLW